ncbi:MAG: DUF202 domain-containing protein [Frankia sp.]
MTSPRPDDSDDAGRSGDEVVEGDRPGLAFERTYVAWQRTGLAFGAVGLLFLHADNGPRHQWGFLPGLFGLAVGVAIVALGALRYQPVAGPDSGPDLDGSRPLVGIRGPAALLAVMCGAILLAIGGLALMAAG